MSVFHGEHRDDLLHRVLFELALITIRRINEMAIDVTKITAAAQRAEAGIESVLAVLSATQAQVTDLKNQLAAAIAANDPAALAAVQAQLDQLAAGLDSESDKIATATTQPPATPTP